MEVIVEAVPAKRGGLDKENRGEKGKKEEVITCV